MKKRNYLILLIVILFVSCVTYDRAITPEEMKTYEKIFEIPNTNQNELYVRANSWFVNAFKSAESVIQFQDKDAGKIMGKYRLFITIGHPLSLTAGCTSIITVDIKDNKARLFITGLESDYGADMTKDLEAIKSALITWDKLASTLEKTLNESIDW
jgi:hypothetical protein